jgi:hypothetical protein
MKNVKCFTHKGVKMTKQSEVNRILLEAFKKVDKIAEELVNIGDMTSEGRAAIKIANRLHKIVQQAIQKAEKEE